MTLSIEDTVKCQAEWCLEGAVEAIPVSIRPDPNKPEEYGLTLHVCAGHARSLRVGDVYGLSFTMTGDVSGPITRSDQTRTDAE